MREVSELEDSNSRRHAGRDSNTTIIPKDNMTLKSSLVRSASVSEPEVGELGESLAPAADLTTLAVPTPPIRKAEAEPSSPFAFRAPCASDLCRGEAEYRYDYCGPCLKEHPEAKRREEISVACQETSCVNTWEVHPQNRTLSKYCPQLHRLTKRREARELESKIFRAKQLR